MLDGAAASAEERFSRGALGAAGHDAEAGEIRLDHWRLGLPRGAEDRAMTLEATVGAAALWLRLTPAKAALLPEGGGGPFRGYAMTRLDATGRLERDGETRAVSGVAWLDHAWGDLPPPGGPIAYDRLQLHLADGTDLSLVRTRRRDGGGTPSVDGFAVGPEGEVRDLGGASMTAEDGDRGGWPLRWRVEAGALSLSVSPVVAGQRRDFVEPVWSGLVRAEGRGPEGPVAGVGTLNLTGYETP
jgi:predicted secreted hydrolase